ncbi:protease FtsH subunit HflC [Azomonas agilis]|uniref:Protein HflC n=1 Tax=Azomonas agilis TaxID=116849 RepID=A0A562J287_9GAMM|nr:protease modulator HflC [Azomonas agilis]TWH77222.1 protease FtsH subunit HflC [Azomonas agilis]
MSNKSLATLMIGGLLAVVLWNSFFIVAQTERAVMLRFGKVVESDLKPGLHMKIPYVNSVRRFDGRLLTLDSTTARFLTLEKKALMVDSYAKWRVDDAERYYTATSGVKQIADERLARRLEAALRDQIGKRTLHEAVSGQRDELMAQVTATLNRAVQQELGIEVIDVRVKAIDLPREVNRSVFERMSSEREREAREHRAKGRELAEGIRADADRQRNVILAESFRKAEELRGEGDAKAAAIYAKAYTQDPEFYAFHRGLQAMRESFSSKEDILVLDPNTDFLRYFKQANQPSTKVDVEVESAQ